MRRMVMRVAMRGVGLAAILASGFLRAADAGFASAQQKLDMIEAGRAARGSSVVFTESEANAWARGKLAEVAPQGVRNLRLSLGAEVVTGAALVDFLKLREAGGQGSSWFWTRMLQGERPVNATIRVVSTSGRATVYLTRVEISNAAATGSLLDFLIQNFVRTLYPAVKINQPIELDDPVERIDVRPGGVRVTMKK